MHADNLRRVTNRKTDIVTAETIAFSFQGRFLANENDLDIQVFGRLEGTLDAGSRPIVATHRVEHDLHTRWSIHKCGWERRLNTHSPSNPITYAPRTYRSEPSCTVDDQARSTSHPLYLAITPQADRENCRRYSAKVHTLGISSIRPMTNRRGPHTRHHHFTICQASSTRMTALPL